METDFGEHLNNLSAGAGEMDQPRKEMGEKMEGVVLEELVREKVAPEEINGGAVVDKVEMERVEIPMPVASGSGAGSNNEHPLPGPSSGVSTSGSNLASIAEPITIEEGKREPFTWDEHLALLKAVTLEAKRQLDILAGKKKTNIDDNDFADLLKKMRSQLIFWSAKTAPRQGFSVHERFDKLVKNCPLRRSGTSLSGRWRRCVNSMCTRVDNQEEGADKKGMTVEEAWDFYINDYETAMEEELFKFLKLVVQACVKRTEGRRAAKRASSSQLPVTQVIKKPFLSGEVSEVEQQGGVGIEETIRDQESGGVEN